MTGAAAFFDLDRTLLLGSSGPIISEGLRRHGVIGSRQRRIERLLFGVFDTVGETLPSMLISRQGARAARGWSQAAVRAVGVDVAPALAAAVQPYARRAIEDHRARGDRIVVATTTPLDVVEPLAEQLGLDAVLATRYRVGPDGRYDGTIDGEFVWSRGKARMVRVWARANAVDLADSHAYSDSVFDVPLLSSVGHPVAVNPDPRLLVYARAAGWPTLWFNAPPGVPKPVGVELQDVLARMVRPELFPWIRIDVAGVDHLPEGVGCLLAANHRSYLDPLLVAFAGAQAQRPVRFLAKREVTDAPIVGPITTALGAIRVDRGSGSDEPLLQAAAVLAAGELVAVFPQGTIPRGRDFFDPRLRGRHGTARLALVSGAPVVPIGLWGSERAWPRNSRFPYVMNLADPPTVRIRVGQPYHPSSDDPTLVTEELMDRISALLPAEAARRREPTDAELALTLPRS
ncbi:MAG: HAD-IB family hydrolase [Acidimicrobiales bacterium]